MGRGLYGVGLIEELTFVLHGRLVVSLGYSNVVKRKSVRIKN